MTLKELIRKAVEELVRQGKEEFTTEDIYQEVKKLEPERKRESVLAALSGLVVGHKHHFYKSEDQFLDKVRRGVYRLYDEARDKKRRDEAEELITWTVITLTGRGFSNKEIAEILEKKAKRLRRKSLTNVKGSFSQVGGKF